MAQLPDVSCWIKVIDDSTGKVVPDGAGIEYTTGAPPKVIVRYVVANDGDQPVGPLTVVGALFRDGVRVQPGGQPNVVPAQQITIQPKQSWKHEHTVSEASTKTVQFVASMLGDVGNFFKEEDEANNRAKSSFSMYGTAL